MRPLLPQNFIFNKGIIGEAFQNPTEWTLTGDGTKSADNMYFLTGSQSLKLTTSSGGTLSAVKNVSLNLRDFQKLFLLKFYVYDPTTVSAVYFDISSKSDFSTMFERSTDGSYLVQGWNTLPMDMTSWEIHTDSFNYTMAAIRIKLVAKSGSIATVSFSEFVYDFDASPKIMIHFDDALESAFTKGFSIMNEFGFKGTTYVPWVLINTEGYMNWGQCKDMYDAGWDLGNHTDEHVNLTAYSPEQAQAHITSGTNMLVENGFDRAAYHLAYPYGEYNSEVIARTKQAGQLTARTITGLGTYPDDNNLFALSCLMTVNYIDVPAVKSFIDKAILQNSSLCILFHGLVDSNPDTYQWTTGDFREVLKHIAIRNITPVTITEWFAYIRNPRRFKY